MKNSLPKRLGWAALRAALIFLAFNLISALSRAIFEANLFDETMLSPGALGAWNTALLFLIFESTVFAFHRHRFDARQIPDGTCAYGGFTGIVKSTFSSMDLYVEYVLIALFSLLVPLSFDCVGMAFFGEGFTAGQVMAVSLPILLVLEIIAHLSVRGAWETDVPKEQTAKAGTTSGKTSAKHAPWTRTVKVVGFTAVVYCVASLVIPLFLPFLVTLANLGGSAMVFVYVAVAIVIALLAVMGVYCLRAVKKRREFIARLKKYCAAQSVTLSPIRKPYRSLFAQHQGVDFTVETDGRVYACKLVGSVFPGSPMVFTDTGEGIRRSTLRMFRVDLFQLNTRLDYRMADAPAESEKILIALPIPKNIYASVDGAPPRPADTGEALGAYTLYNATGFFGALERGYLGVRK